MNIGFPPHLLVLLCHILAITTFIYLPFNFISYKWSAFLKLLHKNSRICLKNNCFKICSMIWQIFRCFMNLSMTTDLFYLNRSHLVYLSIIWFLLSHCYESLMSRISNKFCPLDLERTDFLKEFWTDLYSLIFAANLMFYYIWLNLWILVPCDSSYSFFVNLNSWIVFWFNFVIAPE